MIDTELFILAGGLGRRLGSDRPKALTPVGSRAILDHVLTWSVIQGVLRVSVAVGAGAEAFASHYGQPVEEPVGRPVARRHRVPGGHLDLRLLATGDRCDTGGRLRRLRPLIDATFLLCWCDGLFDVDLAALLADHRRGGRMATLTAVHPPSRFGCLDLEGDRVAGYREKPVDTRSWISGGLFVLEPEVLDAIGGDDTSFERDLLPGLAEQDQLTAHRHDGAWHCMDTPADHQYLDGLIRAGRLPWLEREA